MEQAQAERIRLVVRIDKILKIISIKEDSKKNLYAIWVRQSKQNTQTLEGERGGARRAMHSNEMSSHYIGAQLHAIE